MAHAIKQKQIGSSQDVSPSEIEPALNALWNTQHEHSAEGGATPVRACGLTIIAIASGTESGLAEELAHATELVPARTILAQLNATVPQGIAAQVSGFCQTAAGGEEHVCHEQVLLQASRDHGDFLAPVVSPLIVPDLPAVLLLKEPSLLSSSVIQRFLPLVDVIIADSHHEGAKKAFPVVAPLLDLESPALRDMAFERLTPWRDAVADAWDRAQSDGLVFSDILLTCHEDDVEGALLMGWIRSRLPSDLHPTLEVKTGIKERGLKELRITAKGKGTSWVFSVSRVGHHLVEQESEDGTRAVTIPWPIPDDLDTLAYVLSDPEPDRIYEAALRATQT